MWPSGSSVASCVSAVTWSTVRPGGGVSAASCALIRVSGVSRTGLPAGSIRAGGVGELGQDVAARQWARHAADRDLRAGGEVPDDPALEVGREEADLVR